MVYQAILRRIQNDADGTKDRHVMTAPDAETMDLLYRTVRDTKRNLAKIEWLAPDFYTWEDPEDSISDHAKDLITIFSALWDATVHNLSTILHNEPRADPMNGNTFYTRSKSNPCVYWYCVGGAETSIKASTSGCTRFHFRINVDGDDEDRKTVMVTKDKLEITKADSHPVLSFKNKRETLILTEDDPTLFTPADLKTHFLAQGEPGEGGEEKDAATVKTSDHQYREVWELVS